MAVITDYTSAAIDFSFLDRPVFYYQFDRTRFLGRRPSHFDLDEELPGEIVATRAELMRALTAAARARLLDPPRRAAQGVGPHRPPRHRCSRAHRHRSGQRATPPARPTTAARHHPDRRAGCGPGSSAAPPSSPLLRTGCAGPRAPASTPWPARSRAAAWSPSRATSGPTTVTARGPSTGRIQARGLARPHRVGGHRRTAPVPDGSVRLERLGWRYLWEMGRASVWVSNQNMPSWMRRPDDTFYLQTWHGTPLKRMLHDLDTVVGRDSGYVGRVDRMIGEWSLLLAPSPWAAERLRVRLPLPRRDARRRATRATTRWPTARPRSAPSGSASGSGSRPSKKVLLYAPTFRDDQRTGKRFTFALPIDLAGLAGRGRRRVRDRRAPAPRSSGARCACPGACTTPGPGSRWRTCSPPPTCWSPTTPR